MSYFMPADLNFQDYKVQLNDPLVFVEVAVVHTAVVGTCNAFIDVCNEIN